MRDFLQIPAQVTEREEDSSRVTQTNVAQRGNGTDSPHLARIVLAFAIFMLINYVQPFRHVVVSAIVKVHELVEQVVTLGGKW